ncbi:hypothetical protein [uncultured Muriicola sp.]|uniref:hypothetical protein n=1 Tax=uncultured Muriicola sp. TaxID=1583102 RepID=UPI00262376E7|nr:hypothetical protein [uncultured Muriicola sp.]
MKSNKNLYGCFLKIILITHLFFIGNSNIYAQDSLAVAEVSLSFSDANDVKTIIATAVDASGLPIEELDLYFFVTRTFSLLPIGDVFNTTDENGVVEIEFPYDLPGDTEGNVEIVVKIIESDLYNDLTLNVLKKWGVPTTPLDQSEEKRSLWAAAANAPITLVLATSGMILVIWFIIGYIIFKLFKISRIKPVKS